MSETVPSLTVHARECPLELPDPPWAQLPPSEAEQRLRTLLDYAPDAIVMLDVETGRFLDANLAAEKLFGLPRALLLEQGPYDLSPRYQPGGPSAELGQARIAEAVQGGATVFEWWHQNAQHERFPCDVHLVRMPWQNRVVVRGSIVEATGRYLLAMSEIGRRQIFERLAHGASLAETLDHLVRAIEKLLPGMHCSVLLLDPQTKCLRHGAAPSLPGFYNAAVDGLPIGPTIGSCGAAAFAGRRVVVSEIATHPNWIPFRELAARAQVKACWSEPIFSLRGDVLGTFAMYFPEPGEPAAVELMAIELAAQLAATAIERVQAQHSLQALNATLERRIAEETQHLVEANHRLHAAEQDARLSAVAFESHDSIVITDKFGRILRVNQSFTKLTGYTAAEVIGQTPRVLRSGLHGDEFYREMWWAIDTDGFWEGEIWNKKKNGQVYLQRLTITAVRNACGEITHYVADGQDLTREKQAEASRAEILAAREVQQALLPSQSPALPGFDIAGAVYSADSVSGDFYDFLYFNEQSIGLVVADVSGHGLAPGLLMAQTQAHLRSLAELRSDPGEILNSANRFLTRSRTGHFVTMLLGRLEVPSRTFVYAAAGHQGYLFKANGEVHVLHSTDIPLGVEAEFTASPSPAIALDAGDLLLLPTDGIEEAMNSEENLFGRARMLAAIRSYAHQSAAEMVAALYAEVLAFIGEGPPRDDVTAVVVKVLPQ